MHRRTTEPDEIAWALNAGSMWDKETNSWMACQDLIWHPNQKMQDQWMQAGIDKFARLAQGCENDGFNVAGMDILDFISDDELPQEKKATHACCAADCRPKKDDGAMEIADHVW